MNSIILSQNFNLYDENAERAVLGSLIAYPETLDLLHQIDKFDFYLENHRIIFDAIRKLYSEGKQINVILLKNELESIDKLPYVGGIQYLYQLADEAVPKDITVQIIDILKEKRFRRDLLEYYKKIEEKIASGKDISDIDIEEFLRITENIPRKREEIYRESLFVDAEIPLEDKEEEKFILEPFIPSKSIVLLDGIGGLGKSFFAMELAFALSIGESFLLTEFKPRQAVPILYLTAEDSPDDFRDRLLEIKRAYQYEGKADNFYWISSLSSKFPLQTSTFFTKEHNKIVKTEMTDYLEFLIKETGAKLIVIDSLINWYGLNENSSDDAVYFYNFLKYLIRKYKLSFLILHHQSKGGLLKDASKEDKFRGSGVFREQARARIVMRQLSSQEEKQFDEPRRVKAIEIEKLNKFSQLKEIFPLYVEFKDGAWRCKHVKEKSKHNEKNNNDGKSIDF
jgi:KaiC/GvpD/RAD55 family RecA-like ATPase